MFLQPRFLHQLEKSDIIIHNINLLADLGLMVVGVEGYVSRIFCSQMIRFCFATLMRSRFYMLDCFFFVSRL